MSDALASVSGLVSGLNWRDIVDQIIQVDRSRVSLLENRRDEYDLQLAEWKNINSKLLSIQSAAQSLTDEDTYNIFKSSLASSSATDAENILSVSTTNSAARGTYNIRVLQKAQSLKLGSTTFDARTESLGFSGEFVLNGQSVSISTDDSLEDIRDTINQANSGSNASDVTATIISNNADQHQLILTSDDTGGTGFSLLDASTTDLLQNLGFVGSNVSIKNQTSDGAMSDTFASSATAVGSLRGLSSIPGSTSVTIAGQAVNIDLSSESLSDIAANIDALTGVTASVVSETDDNDNTGYRLDISGTTSFADTDNVLQILGVLQNDREAVNEIHASGNALTTTSGAGGGAITDATLWSEINTGGDANNISVNDTIDIVGTDHDGNAVNTTFTISNLSQSLDASGGFLESIEDAFGGSVNVNAYISDGSDGFTAGQLVVEDLQSGDSLIEVSLFAGNEGGGDLDFGDVTEQVTGRNMELVTGADARVEVDGAIFVRESNSISDLIAGATLNLVSADTSTTVTLAVERDVDAVKEEIQGFIDSFNSLITDIGEQMSFDQEDEEVGGILFGDSTLRSVKSELIDQALSSVSGLTSSFTSLSLIGINLQEDGTLKINNDKLTGLLNSNFSEVIDLLAVRGEGSVNSLNFIDSGRHTVAGTYNVNITQAASRGSVTGTTDLSGGLAGAEVVTLTDSLTNRIATVNLDAGDSIDEIISKFNTEFETTYAQETTLSVNNTLIAGGAINAETVWQDIDTTGGGANDISNGAVISFSGIRRGGIDVTGSYTIDDISTDKVQGLLSEIESTFNNEVYATIDSNGAIVVTDREAGSSQMTFQIDSVTDGGSLDLGTASTTTTGRYKIEMTASNDGSNHLVLNHDSYGSAYGFSISQTVDNLGITDQDYIGQDVEGTINGEAATGSGQILRGNADESNIDGLVVEYTGTTTGAIGDISVTLGVMENMYRSIYGLTDEFEGYVGFKMDSLSDNIERMGSRIDQVEAQLDLKRQRLISQFLTMENTIAKLNSQGAWLQQQLG